MGAFQELQDLTNAPDRNRRVEQQERKEDRLAPQQASTAPSLPNNVLPGDARWDKLAPVACLSGRADEAGPSSAAVSGVMSPRHSWQPHLDFA